MKWQGSTTTLLLMHQQERDLTDNGWDGLCGCRRSVADFVADEEQSAQKL